jgi:mannose-6-phosphate isomerase-like protein (cupin superfamily)
VRHLIKEATESYAIGVVDVFPLDNYPVGHRLPFGSLWYTLPPNSTSKQDCHPEVEMSIVVSGTASVEASGEITEVATGGIFLLDPEEAHIIHNRSADRPLMVFTTYWMPLAAGDGAVAGAQVPETEALPQS